MFVGDRRIRISEGMQRVVEDGQVKGATMVTKMHRDRLIDTLALDGLDTHLRGVAPTIIPKRGGTTAKRSTSGGTRGSIVTDSTWRYDQAKNRHWSPVDKQWHDGPPPHARQRQPGEEEWRGGAQRTIATPGSTEDETGADRPTAVSAKPATKPVNKPAKPVAERVFVRMTTNHGPFTIELFPDRAPKSVENFLRYVDEGYYDGTVFHRVIDGFMVQGGGFTEGYERKPTYDPVVNEWTNGLKNKRGTVAMARLGRQPDSATSQFFINVRDNPFLDEPRDGAGYAVFGEIIGGMPTVDEIKKLKTHTLAEKGMQNVPLEPVIIEQAERIQLQFAPQPKNNQ